MAALVLVGRGARPADQGATCCRPDTATGTFGELLEGFQVLREEPQASLLVGLLGSQYVAIGMLDVLYAPRDRHARMGQGGAGYLNAAFGAGGVLGQRSPHHSSGGRA